MSTQLVVAGDGCEEAGAAGKRQQATTAVHEASADACLRFSCPPHLISWFFGVKLLLFSFACELS
jgi:hypothetical protein